MILQNNDTKNNRSSTDATLGRTSIRKRIAAGFFILGILLFVLTFTLPLRDI